MTRIEDVKKTAEEFMDLQLRFYSEMQSLNEDELAEFMKWFGNRPQNLAIRKYAEVIFK